MPAPADVRVRILRNAIVLLSGQAALTLASAISTFVLARYLGTTEFGEYSAVIGFVGLFLPIASIGLDRILIREMTYDPMRARAIFGSGLILRFGASIVAALVCIGISTYLDYSIRDRELIAIWSLSLIFSSSQLFQVPFALGLNNVRPVRIIASIAMLGVAARIILVMAGVRLHVYLVSDLLVSLGTLLYLWRAVKIHSGFSPEWMIDWAMIRKLLKASLPLLLSGALVAVYQRLDQQFMLFWRGSRELGEYAAAVRLAELFSLFPVFFMQSAFPIISTAGVQAKKTPLRISATCYRYLFLLSFPALFLGIVFAKGVIQLLYGSTFLQAASALPWLLLAELPVIAGIIYGQFSVAANLQMFDALFTFINAATNLGLCIALIPRMGMVGAAIASLIGYAVSFPVQLFFSSTRPYSVVALKESARILGVGTAAWIAFVLGKRLLPGALAVAVSFFLFAAIGFQTGLIRREDSRFFREILQAGSPKYRTIIG